MCLLCLGPCLFCRILPGLVISLSAVPNHSQTIPPLLWLSPPNRQCGSWLYTYCSLPAWEASAWVLLNPFSLPEVNGIPHWLVLNSPYEQEGSHTPKPEVDHTQCRVPWKICSATPSVPASEIMAPMWQVMHSVFQCSAEKLAATA